MDGKVYLCEYCIEAMRSHGEKVFEGEIVTSDEIDLICEFCEEEWDSLTECIIK